MKEKFKEIADQYNACKTDWERLHFLKKHPDKLKAVLDNDVTMVEFMQPKDMNEDDYEDLLDNLDIDFNSFDDYHYWNAGCLLLFKFAGITAEFC